MGQINENKAEKAEKLKEAEKTKEAEKLRDIEKSREKSKDSTNQGSESPQVNKGASKEPGNSDVGGEIRKLREDLKLMLAEMDQRMSIRLKDMDDKFTNMFNAFKTEMRQEMGGLKVELETTKTNVEEMAVKVDGIEKECSVSFR